MGSSEQTTSTEEAQATDEKPSPKSVQNGFWSKPLSLIQYHYGNTTGKPKSPSQIQRESFLLPGIKFSRWFIMPAGVLVQFCVGSLYAWSVFNKPIDTLIYGHVTNIAPITFTIAIGLLGFSAAVMGPWLERNGPRQAAILGASCFFLGNMLTALALWFQLMWLVFLGYGVIGGFGIGLCYISPVSVLQKWFPDRRGLASGVAVCGFGAGSIVMAKVQVVLLNAVGLPWTFVTLGCVYFVVMVVAAMVLRTPPPGYMVMVGVQETENDGMKESATTINTDTTADPEVGKISTNGSGTNVEIQFQTINGAKSGESEGVKIPVPPDEEISLMEALKSRDFHLMYVMFLSNIIFGLVLISRLSNMVTDIFGRSATEASTIVSLNGGFNLAGRLLFSISSDYVGRKNCYVIMLTTQALILASFSSITTARAYWTFLATMWTLTTCYGAGFSVIPAFLSDKFGSRNIGACHGVILTAWSIAGVVGGGIFTAVFNSITSQSGYDSGDPHAYNVNAWWLFAVVCCGWIAMICVKPTQRDQLVIKKLCCWSWS